MHFSPSSSRAASIPEWMDVVLHPVQKTLPCHLRKIMIIGQCCITIRYLEAIDHLLICHQVWEQQLVKEVRKEPVVDEWFSSRDWRPRSKLAGENPPVFSVSKVLIQCLGGGNPGLGVGVPARVEVVGRGGCSSVPPAGFA